MAIIVGEVTRFNRIWRGAVSSRQGAACGEFAFEIDAGAKVDRRHPRGLRSAHVGDEFVDEQQVARPSSHTLEQDFVDARVRLHNADMAGDHARVEFTQKVVMRLDKRECLGGEVAERVNRPAGGLETAQKRDVLLDRSADRLDPPLVEEP